MLEQIQSKVSEHIRDLIASDTSTQADRTQVETMVGALLELVNEGRQWSDAMQALKEKLPAEGREHWVATLEVHPEHGALFVNTVTGEKKYIKPTKDEALITAFSQKCQELITDFKIPLKVDKTGMLIPEEHVDGGPGTLNAAFLLQTLMGGNPFNHGLDAVSTALKVQAYAQLVQNVKGLAEDGYHLVELVFKATKTEFQLLNTAAKILGTINMVGNMGLDLLNIGTLLWQLTQSQSDIEQTIITSNLAVATLSSGVNIATLMSGLYGATTTASVLGVLSVPLMGLGIGVTSLVEAAMEVEEIFKTAVSEFDQLLDDFNQKIDKKSTALFGEKSVVTDINFIDNTFSYGNVTISTSGASGGSNEKGWRHGELKYSDEKLNVYEGFGWDKKPKKDNALLCTANVFVLPSNLNVHFKSHFNTSFGFDETKNPEAFMKLHKTFGEKFIWGITNFPIGGQTIALEKPQYQKTDINIVLDDKPRQMIVPTMQDDAHRNQLSYNLAGNGGSYSIILSQQPVSMSLVASHSDKERWTFNVESLIKDSTTVNDQITFGKLKNNVLDSIVIKPNELTIGAQKVIFAGKDRPKNLTLVSSVTLVDGEGSSIVSDYRNDAFLSFTLGMQIDVAKQSKQVFVSFETELEALASLPHLANNLRPVVQTGMVSITVGDAHGLVDLDRQLS